MAELEIDTGAVLLIICNRIRNEKIKNRHKETKKNLGIKRQ